MLGPTRIFLSLRHSADAGLLAAVASVSVTFVATPFLIPELAAEFDITIGQAGLMSTAQVGAFALVVFIAGRRFRTNRRFLIGAALTSVLVNLASVVAPTYGVLLAIRSVAGGAAGIMVWLSWAKAMRLSGSMRTVAATGPLTVLVAAPFVGWLAARGGTDAVFLFLAAASLPAALLPAAFVGYRHERRRMSPSRSNVALVIAMGVMTMSGTSLFVYTATRGAAIGVSTLIVSLAFSTNALAGYVAARISPSGGSGGLWVLAMGLCAAGVGFSSNRVLFGAGMVVWGFCFWMATPRILQSIALWSLAPDERVGDTQSAMATGRAIGPAVGGLLVGTGTFAGLATFAVVGLAMAGVTVIGVASHRRGLEVPSMTSPSA